MKSPNYTAADDAYLAANYAKHGAQAVADALGRTKMGVMRRACVLRISADPHRKNPNKGPRKPRLQGYKPSQEIKIKGKGPAMTVMGTKIRAAQFVGEPKITAETRVTIARPFVDTRFVPVGPVPRVVDPAQCRGWAKVASC
jgi:hypothetical protein